MPIWTCKAPVACVCFSLLAGCADMPGAALLGGLASSIAPRAKAVSQAEMANGALTLVAPQGFCIDQRSLGAQFALMARCDTLAKDGAAGAAPLGVIIISVTAANPDAALPTPEQTATAASLKEVTAITSEPDALTYQASGTPPSDRLDAEHWRGTARINRQFLGIALYGPTGSRAFGAEGREIINELIRRSRAGG